MASDSQLRLWYATYRCDINRYTRVAFPGVGRQWDLFVATPAVEAFQTLAEVMAETGYLFRESAGGTYNCRKIAGSSKWSIHAYALAIDLNPSKNPHRIPLQHDFPQTFLDAVAGIETGNGKPVFKWGGTWTVPDAMHFQVDVSPTDLSTGITRPAKENLMTVSSWAQASWDKAKSKGIITEDSIPKAEVTVEQLMVFLNRAGAFDQAGQTPTISEAEVRAIVNSKIVGTQVSLRPPA